MSDKVAISNDGFTIDRYLFRVRGIAYNPVAIGQSNADLTAPTYDVPRIAAMGATTISTYMCGYSQWEQWTISTGQGFYKSLYPAAERYGLKIIVAYYSNQSIDWRDVATLGLVTTQYQQLVTLAKNRPSTLCYLIGNEILEKLSPAQGVAYAKWLGAMVDWTHTYDPNHPVMYADRGDSIGLPALRQHAPHLDIYGVNNYSFTNTMTLKSAMAGYAAKSGKPVLLHEWGCDSLNNWSKTETEEAQASRIVDLARAVDADPIGGCLFEFTDEPQFAGSAAWPAPSCFDGLANEAHWGISRSVRPDRAANRVMKKAYGALKSYWTTS